jgi:hypothetical protein
VRLQGSPEPTERRVPRDVEDDVIASGAVGKVLQRVIDDAVGAERGHEARLRGAAGTRDLGTEGFGNLDRVAADPSRRSEHEDGLPGFDMPHILDRTECRGSRHRNDGGLGERQVLRLAGELALLRHRVFSERAGSHAVDLVAHRKPGDGRSDSDDGAGDVAAHDGLPRSAKAHGESHRVRLAGHQVLGAPVEASCVYLHENVVVGSDHRHRRLGLLEDLCAAVPALGDGAHRGLGRSVHGGCPFGSMGAVAIGTGLIGRRARCRSGARRGRHWRARVLHEQVAVRRSSTLDFERS